MYVYKSTAESRFANAHHVTNSALTGSRSPAGPRRRRKADTRHRRASASSGCSFGGNFAGNISRAVAGGGKAPVSACVPLCAIFLREPSVYPLLPTKAGVGHLCEKLKIGMRSGWGQRCNGNFLAIFAGVFIGEKPNFTGRFFKWRRPFDFSTR